jgi:hypothetical protein
MDWLGGYPTACHRAMFAASNSMNLRCSLASDFGVSPLGLAGHRLFRHEAVVRSAMKLVGRRSECGMLDRPVKAEMELAFAVLRIRHAKDGRPPPCFNRAGNKLAPGSVVPFDNLECTELNIGLTAARRKGQS